MRIVYDDAKQGLAIHAVEEFFAVLSPASCSEYEWGTIRVQMSLIKQELNRFLSRYSLFIGNTVTHAHGIGNNCRYPVYYRADDVVEVQHCCNINLNTGMYGEGYVSCEDYNGSRVGPAYKITPRSITRTMV